MNPQFPRTQPAASPRLRGLISAPLLAAASLLFAGPMAAATIFYEATQLPSVGLNERWAYEFLLDASAFDLNEGFAITFDLGDYENLAEPSAPNSDWNAIVLQPDLLLPDHGFFDAQAQVASPASAGTFRVVFDWLGTAPPGPQSFEIYDASFNSVEQGFTTPIPSPSTALLMTLGLFGLGIHARGPRRKPPTS